MSLADTGLSYVGRVATLLGVGLALAALAPGSAGGVEPGAFELLAATRAAYAQLDAYRDRGAIEEVAADGSFRLLGRFETVALPAPGGGAGRFRFALLVDGEIAAAVWNVDGAAFAFDGASGLYARLGAAGPAGLQRILPELFDALAVPALLAGDRAALDFEAASYDGREPCPGGDAGDGDDRCFVVSAIRMSGALEYRLWLDARSRLVRRLELTAYPAEAILGRAAAEAGLAPAPAGGVAAQPRTFRLTHRMLLDTDRPESATRGAAGADLFGPPEGARRVDVTALPAPTPLALPATGASPGEPQATFSERIEVRRIEVEVRALDVAGEPIVGLGRNDFRVTLDGEEAAVEAVDWLPAGEDAFAAAGTSAAWADLARSGATVPAPGRLTVVFVQSDMEPSRVTGHLRMLRQLDLLFADLQPDDRMAVVSFDSHLKLRQDFSADRGRLASAIEEAATSFGGEPWVGRERRFPSLARHLDPGEAKRAATPERALELTARALAGLPGPKSILFVGYGLGRFDARSGRVAPAPGYEEARRVLADAGIPVFVLDISDSAAHSLELGLQQVAEDTGGRYERMAFFPAQAAKRLVRVIGDRYVVVFVRPAGLPTGEHRLRIELVDRRGTVLAPRIWTDPPAR